jgi:hypothetical protein
VSHDNLTIRQPRAYRSLSSRNVVQSMAQTNLHSSNNLLHTKFVPLHEQYEFSNAASYGMYRFVNERCSLVEVKVIEKAV